MAERPPNILLIQADQLTAFALAAYGNAVCRTPRLDRLAEAGVVFEQAYCNVPLCAPSRFSMMTGLLAPDQLHGFETRLTSDIYPADFQWTADWSRERHKDVSDARVVTRAGPCRHSVQIAYDDLVTFQARRWLEDQTRDPERPFLLTVSFTHPHDPFVCQAPYWQLYEDVAIDPPRAAPIPEQVRDPHSRRLLAQSGLLGLSFTEEQVLTARRGYYGAISYLDARIGEVLDTLERCGFAGETVEVFTSDHGEMLGERGMWLKKCFFEPALKVPLIFHAPARFGARRVANTVSLLDLLPTLCGLAGGAPAPVEPLDGLDLCPVLAGGTLAERPLKAEILSEGTTAPAVMLRGGRHKYVACPSDPPQLYDLKADPLEMENLAGRPETADIESRLAAEVAKTWDLEALGAAVRQSQRRRLLVQRAHAEGRAPAWDFEAGGTEGPWFRGQSSYNDWAFDYR
jgi:choline-sulfatase